MCNLIIEKDKLKNRSYRMACDIIINEYYNGHLNVNCGEQYTLYAYFFKQCFEEE